MNTVSARSEAPKKYKFSLIILFWKVSTTSGTFSIAIYKQNNMALELIRCNTLITGGYMSLKEELEKIRPNLRTDNYSMSIGELINLYESNEIEIHPEFQRFFRWSDIQKSRFIESILLGIPIPPIFVSQRDDGIWDVVDGLQRLSTIYQFMGKLKDAEGKLRDPLLLKKTKYLPSLDGKKWEDGDNPENSLDTSQRLDIKRAKIHVNIIQKESDAFAKYELFQRLNTGGSRLSDQELRNCLLVWVNKKIFNWMYELSQYKNFKECVSLTDGMMEEQYDMELISRFLVFRTIDEGQLKGIDELSEFLTDKITAIAQLEDFDYEKEGDAFKRTFDILYESTGGDSFQRFDRTKEKYIGGFYISPFEVLALGIGYNYQKINNTEKVKSLISKFWKKDISSLKTGSGVSASTRIPSTIPYGRELFNI